MDTKRIVGRSKHLDLCAVDPEKVALPQVDKLRPAQLFQRVYEHCFFIHVDIQNLNLDQIVNLFKLTKFWQQKKFIVLKYTFRLYFIGRLSFLYIGHALD